jgi:hypothetical protein
MLKTVLVLSLILTIITGCSTKSTQPIATPVHSTEARSMVEEIAENWNKHVLQKVTLSRSKQFGEVNPALLATITQPEELLIFAEAIRTAEKMLGQMDIRKPDFDMTFFAEGVQQSLHLWLDPNLDSGLFTTISDTGTGHKLTEEVAGKLRKLIFSLPYTPEQAARNGDIVNIHGKFTNLDKWESFTESVKNGKRDEAHLTSYTIEGGAIFDDLYYDGQSIEYNFDNTKDAFGSPLKSTSFCQDIEKTDVEKGTEYTLSGCDRPEAQRTFYLVIPK